MKLDYNNNLKQIIDCIEAEKNGNDCIVMLYAADDFDDFIAFPKSIDIMSNDELDTRSKDYLKEHNATQFAVLKCGKAFERYNSKSEEAETKEAMKNAMTAKQLCEELKKLDEHTLLRTMTDNGRISFSIVGCQFNHISEEVAEKTGAVSTFFLEGSF